ncbi:MAG: CapA family protein [Lachnospiraceae bacterium]|nr:CapA family protein [Lachnospiraceae bacterium]
MDAEARAELRRKRAEKRKRYVRNRILFIAALVIVLVFLVVVLAGNLRKISENSDSVSTQTDAMIETPADDPLASSGLEANSGESNLQADGDGNSSEDGDGEYTSGSEENDSQDATAYDSETTESNVTNPEETDGADDDTVYEVTLVAIGDVLIHSPLLTMAEQSDGSYDFSGCFSVLKEEFTSADIAIVNQETIFGGASKGYTTYPCFNTPESLGDAEVEAGFDVILHATNHVRDAGTDGIEYCLDYWQTSHPDTTVLGIHDSEEAASEITYYECNGITFAMFNYTYGMNGFTIPSEQSYLVDLMNDDTKAKIIAEIEEADENADFVIVFPHWGTENLVGDISSFQQEWAEIFVEAGADLIIGTHPHVLEPVEWYESANGNRALIFYSLGNYISNQQDMPNNVGGMAKVTVRRQGDETYIVEDESGCVPLINHSDKTGSTPKFRVYRVADYTDDLMSVHTIHRKNSSFTLSYVTDLAEEILGEFLLWS